MLNSSFGLLAKKSSRHLLTAEQEVLTVSATVLQAKAKQSNKASKVTRLGKVTRLEK